MKSPVDPNNYMIFLNLFDTYMGQIVILLTLIDIFTGVKWGAVLYSFSLSSALEEWTCDLRMLEKV